MIQDIFPSRLNNAYKKETADADSFIMIFRNGALLTYFDSDKKDIVFPKMKELDEIPETEYLFSVDNDRYFLSFGKDTEPFGQYGYMTVKELRGLALSTSRSIFAAFTAYHLWKWYDSSRFCGVCGSRTAHSGRERAMVCPDCGNTIYPRINPAVIIGVVNGDKILITRYRVGYAHNALVAGFTEIGETLEQTVEREVMEETGLKVKNIRYYRSQPWGPASDILMGFFCEADGSCDIKMDASELKYAEWLSKDEIELQPDNYSLTNEMMKVFCKGLTF